MYFLRRPNGQKAIIRSNSSRKRIGIGFVKNNNDWIKDEFRD